MADKEMDLLVRIRGRADDATRAFKEVDSHLQKLQRGFGTVGTAARMSFNLIGGAARVFFWPLEMAGKVALGLGAAVGALGGAAIHAAAGEERLQIRLEGVFGSATKAKKAIEEFDRLGRKSGIETDQLVEAGLLLKQFGLLSERNLGILGNAARSANVPIADLAQAVSTLQLRALKRFGIEVEENAGKPLLRWRDKFGKLKQQVFKDKDALRGGLMAVMGGQFGTSLAPRGVKEMGQMLKNNIGDAMETLGTAMLPAVSRLLEYLATQINKLIEGGKLEAWGKKMGEWLTKAVDYAIAGFKTAQELFAVLPTLTRDALLGLLTSLGQGLGKTLLAAFTEAIELSWTVWKGMIDLIASYLADRLQAALGPIMKPIIIAAGATGMLPAPEAAKALAGLSAGPSLTPDKIASTLAGIKARAIEAGRTIGANAKENLITGPQSPGQQLYQQTGFDIGGIFQRNLAAAQLERQAGAMERVTWQGQRGGFREIEPGNPLKREPWSETYTRQEVVPAGTHPVGRQVGGGIIINVERVEINSNTPGRVTEEFIRRAAQVAPAAAAG